MSGKEQDRKLGKLQSRRLEKVGTRKWEKMTRLDGGIREITKTCKMRGQKKFDKTLTESEMTFEKDKKSGT